MKKIEPWQRWTFIGSLAFVAFLISGEREFYRQVHQPAPPTQGTSTPPPASPPVASKPIVWPADVPPTRIIRIPDPQRPATGVMDIPVKSGEEVQIVVDKLWAITQMEAYSEIEWAANDGEGFLTEDAYKAKYRESENAGGSLRWGKERTFRYHFKRGYAGAITMRMVIDKKTEEETGPLPFVRDQKFGDLIIIYAGLTGLKDGGISVDLVFRNTNDLKTIGVAVHSDRCMFMPCHLLTRLTAADGTEYFCDSSRIAGIQSLRAQPRNLTKVAPGSDLRASFKYETRGLLSEWAKSFKLQVEIVINRSFREDQYIGYQAQEDQLPPYCEIINAVFDIPVRRGPR